MNKWRLLYLFIAWDQFSVTEQKVERAFDTIIVQQKRSRDRGAKSKRQRQLTREFFKEMIYLSIQFHSQIIDQVNQHHIDQKMKDSDASFVSEQSLQIEEDELDPLVEQFKDASPAF